MDYAVLAARHFARATALEAALRKIMEAHRWNVAGMSVTDVHAACFDALQLVSLEDPLNKILEGPVNRTLPGQPIPMGTSKNYTPPPDYRSLYEEALAAANEAGYADLSPADVIKAQFEAITDLEASEKAMIDEVEPLLVDVKSALQSHDMDMTGLLARIERALK